MSAQDSSPVSLETLDAFVAERLAVRKTEQRQQRYEGVRPETLLWLALAPGWTIPLAKATGLPIKASVADTFRRLTARGILTEHRSPVARAQGSRPSYFTMSPTDAEHLLNENPDTDLRQTISTIGQRMEKAQASDPDLIPDRIERWARLAAAVERDPGTVEVFKDEVREAYEARNAGDILHWIEAAQSLVGVLRHGLQAELDLAIRRAGLRLELLSRQRHDEQHLTLFYERDAQHQAVRELLDGPDDAWALHLLGAGGVGKTMLVRYVTARLARDEEIPTARVDFDYLNPDFPRLAPGLLFWSFAEELRLHDRTRTIDYLDEADRTFAHLHEELKSPNRSVQHGTEHPLFKRALGFFIDAVAALPRPPLLIVDTCEELTKARSTAVGRENVSETFGMLEALHEAVPGLRVIFAGRRPLAKAGYGWTCTDTELPERPFLRLHELRGFTHTEAKDFLGTLDIEGPLAQAIIQKSSPDARSPVAITWEDPVERPSDEKRCNPYELRLYLDWAREDPPPTPEAIARSTGDQYVQLRILDRLKNPELARLLPLLARLKSFDRDVLQTITELDGADFETFYERLKQQEWIERRLVTPSGQAENRLILSIEEGLRLRLMAYYRKRTALPPTFLDRTADFLEQRTDGDLGMLDNADFDAALRMLDTRPDRARQWWKRLETRAIEERGFDWLGTVASFLSAPGGAAGLPDTDRGGPAQPISPLRLYVLASSAAALLHTDSAQKARDEWLKVTDLLDESADPDLLVTTRAGIISTTGWGDDTFLSGQVVLFWPKLKKHEAELHPETWAAVLAAIETVVEFAERIIEQVDDAHPAVTAFAEWITKQVDDTDLASTEVFLPPADARFFDALPDELAAFGYALRARVAALRDDLDAALEHFRQALNRLPESDTAPRRWRYWIPPTDLPARIRLETIRVLYPAKLSPDETLSLIGPDSETDTPTVDIERDRLRAAIDRLRLAEGVLDRSVDLLRTRLREQVSVTIPDAELRRETCNAHRAFPPSVITTAERLAAYGDVTTALSTLRDLESQSDFDLDTQLHIDRALARLILTMRLEDEGETMGGRLAVSERPEDVALHRRLEPPEEAPEFDPDSLPDPEAWWAEHPREPVEAARLLARHRGVVNPVPPSRETSPLDEALRDRLGRRRFAWILFEEAELLAQSAPTESIFRYEEALFRFEDSNDRVGAFIAATALACRRAVTARGLKDSEYAQNRVASDLQTAQYAYSELYTSLYNFDAQTVASWTAPDKLAGFWPQEDDDPLDTLQPRAWRPWMVRLTTARFFAEGQTASITRRLSHAMEDQWQGLSPLRILLVRKLLVRKLLEWFLNRSERKTGLIGSLRRSLVRFLGRRLDVDIDQTEARQTLKLWTVAQYGTTSEGRVVLPSELNALIDTSDFQGPVMPDDPPTGAFDIPPPPLEGDEGPRAAPLAEKRSAFGTVFAVTRVLARALMGIGSLVALFWGGYRLFQWALGRFDVVDPSGLSTPVLVFLYAVALVLLVGLFFWIGRARRAWYRHYSATMRLHPMSAESTSTGTYETDREVTLSMADTRPRWQFAWSPFGQEVTEHDPITMTTGGLNPYRETARRQQIPWLNQIQPLDPPEPILVNLRASGPLSGFAWEAVLLMSEEGGLFKQVEVFRTGVTPVSSPSGVASPPFIGIRIESDGEVEREAVRQGWATLADRSAFKLDFEEAENARILHLIGRVEERYRTLEFRLSDGSETVLQKRMKRPERLLQTGAIVRQYEGLEVCVLQAPPQALMESRTRSDRFRAILARAFAAELYEAGVPVVIVLPSLELERTVSLIEPLAEVLKRRPRQGVRALAHAVHDIRTRILKFDDLEPDVRVETAFDVTLFCRPNWNGQTALITSSS